MDLFTYMYDKSAEDVKPLAQRMKPVTLDDFYGQEEVVGVDSLLRKMILSDKLTSIILYGPPGVGKTSLANIISNMTMTNFVSINAVFSGVKELKEIINQAKEILSTPGIKTTLFIDEIHRFNKSQQDALLYHVEQGIITLIGATTENPYYEINNALISRSQVFELKKLDDQAIRKIIENAIDNDQILKEYKKEIDSKAIEFIVENSQSDARKALNLLELSYVTSTTNIIEIDDVFKLVQSKSLMYDKNGNMHYDLISAFIKSVRGSDPDAAIYYLAQMLLSGEDVKFIARRLVILASEDIGLADPQALVYANSAFEAVNKIGMPEARIILSQITIYLSLTNKSNSAYLAIDSAMDYIKNNKSRDVLYYLEDQTKRRLENKNIEYKYPHDYKNNYVEQRYLPESVEEKFYNYQENVLEKELVDKYIKRRNQNE